MADSKYTNQEIKSKDILNIQSEQDVIDKYPWMFEKYGNEDAVMFKIHDAKQRITKKNIDIFKYMEGYKANNSFTNLSEFRKKYGNDMDIPADNIKASNMMYQVLRQNVTDNSNSLLIHKNLQPSDKLRSLNINFVDYANGVDPVLESESNIKRNIAFDLIDYQKKILNPGLRKRYSYEQIAESFGYDLSKTPVLINDIEFAKSFMNQKTTKNLAAQNTINKHFRELTGNPNLKVEMSMDDNLDELTFVNPITQETQLVRNSNTPGIESLAGSSLPIAFDLAGMGTIGGGGSVMVNLVRNAILKKVQDKTIRTYLTKSIGGLTKTGLYATGSGYGEGLGDAIKIAYATQILDPDAKVEDFSKVFNRTVNDKAIQPLLDILTEGVRKGELDREDVVKFSGDAALFTGVMDLFYRVGRGFGTLLKGSKVTPEEYKFLTKNIKESEELADFMNNVSKEIRGKYKNLDFPDNINLKYTLAEGSRRPEFLFRQAVQASLSKNIDAFDLQKITQMKALNNIFKTYIMGASKKNIEITRQIVDQGGDFATTKLGKDIQGIINDYRDPIKRAKLDKLAKNYDEVNDITLGYPTSKASQETELRKPLELVFDKFYKDVNELYDNIKLASQVTKVGKIPTNNFYKAIGSIKKRERDTLINTSNPVQELFKTKKEGVSFAVLRNTKSDLMKLERDGFFRKNFREGDFKKLIDSIDADMEAWAKSSEKGKAKDFITEERAVVNDWAEASKIYSEGINNLGGVLKSVLKKNSAGQYEIAGENVFTSTFRSAGSQNRFKNLFDLKKIMDDDADFKNAYLTDLRAFYKRQVFKEKPIKTKAGDIETFGIDPTAHKQFMKDFGDNIEYLFPEEYAKLNSVKDKLKVFDDRILKHNREIDELNIASGGKITEMNPELILRDLWDPEAPQKFLDVVKILKQSSNKQIMGDLQAGILRKFQAETSDRAADAGTNFFNPLKYTDFMKKNEQLLTIAMSPEQIKFLRRFEVAVDIANDSISKQSARMRQAYGELGPEDISVGALRSLYFRPLSAKGVAFTNFLNNYSVFLNNKLGDILLEPDSKKALDRLAKLYNAGKYGEAHEAIKSILKLPATYEFLKEYVPAVKDKTIENITEEQKNSIFEKVKKIKDEEQIRKNQSNLSQAPINVAQIKPQPQGSVTNNQQRPVASGSVTDKQQTLQGLASLGMNLFS